MDQSYTTKFFANTAYLDQPEHPLSFYIHALDVVDYHDPDEDYTYYVDREGFYHDPCVVFSSQKQAAQYLVYAAQSRMRDLQEMINRFQQFITED